MDTLNKVRESTDSLVRPQAVKKDSADSLTRTQTTNARLSSESISRTQTSKAKESTESLSRTQTTKRDSQILAPRLNRLSTIRTRDTSDSIDVLNALRPKEHIDRLGQVMMSADSLIGPRPVDKSKQSLEKKPDKKVEKKKATEQDIIGILKWKYSKVEASEIYSVKFSPDGMYLAVGNGDSKISIYSTITNNLEFVLDPHMPKPLPVTAICFRPNHESFGTKNVLAASCIHHLT